MPDESATSLPAPEGAADGLHRDGARVEWFDGQPREVDVAYVAGGRTVALGGQAGDGALSAYGAWVDGIVTRGADAQPARFVAGQWLSGGNMVGQTLLSDALRDFLGWTDGAAPLQLDDRPVLGLGGPVPTTVDARHWAAAVTGELALPGLAEALPLRPALAARDGDVLTLHEPGAGAGGDDVLELKLALAPGAGGQAALSALTLNTGVALLLDETIDGAWERPALLWLSTATGMLRIEQDAPERAPYAFFSESRNVDVRRWFPALDGAGAARLMLDRSGAKTLSVSRQDGALSLTLTVWRPALVCVLPAMALDGAGLAAPRLPPGRSAMARAVALQLVPPHLCGDGASSWRLDADGEMRLRRRVPGDALPSGLTHFTGHDNWVRPPEAACNEAPGMSPLRVLIPMLPDGGEQRFALRSGPAGAWIEPLDGFGTMAPEAEDFGPLAGFDADHSLARERWPAAAAAAPAPAPGPQEPAVLRPLYRLLPPGTAADGAPAGFAATRVRDGAPSTAADVAPVVLDDEDVAAQRRHALQPGGGPAQARVEDPAGWPGVRFGWAGREFLAPQALPAAAGAAPPDPALAWVQLGTNGANATATGWARLGDDSLVRLAPVEADSPDAALQALAGAGIDRPAAGLMAGEPDASWGLAHLRIAEDGAGAAFTLTAGAAALPVAAGGDPRVNRIVLALAPAAPVEVTFAPGIRTERLNRVYLELERRGGRLAVTRAMLGWSAATAFGWPRKAADEGGAQFHVTERYERVDGVLRRSVEYNGALSRQLDDGQGIVELYFWDTVQEDDAGPLRLICHYRLRQNNDVSTSICALQDAMPADGGLDLSADVAILRTLGATREKGLAYPWDPDRRRLYRLSFDSVPGSYSFGGFLKIRQAAHDGMRHTLIDNRDEARVVPAWFLCERDLIPWFDASSAPPALAGGGWTPAGRLRTGDAATPARERLAIELYGLPQFNWQESYACTLLDEAADGIPLWVPSPVRVPQAAADTAAPAAENVLRLWLFDPGARLVAQWTPAPGIEDGRQEAAARQEARQRLWAMGWTREAVLERPRAGVPGEVDWLVVDSPLLNRGASLAWFGWPLAPDAEYPAEPLPATRQVPWTRRGGQQSYALQVEFENDPAASTPALMLVADPGYPGFGSEAPQNLTFRSDGMRVGVRHKLVAYGAPEGLALAAAAPLAAPPRRTLRDLAVQGERLVWGAEPVDLGQEGPRALPGGILEYTLPYACGALRIGGAAPGLQWQAADGKWAPADQGAWLEPDAPITALRLAMPAPARWGTLELALRKPGAAPADVEIVTLFPAGGTRLGGVFDGDGRLLAFGDEQAFYVAPAELPEAGSSAWTREAGVTLAPRVAARAALAARVLTIDLDGQEVEHLP